MIVLCWQFREYRILWLDCRGGEVSPALKGCPVQLVLIWLVVPGPISSISLHCRLEDWCNNLNKLQLYNTHSQETNGMVNSPSFTFYDCQLWCLLMRSLRERESMISPNLVMMSNISRLHFSQHSRQNLLDLGPGGQHQITWLPAWQAQFTSMTFLLKKEF